MREKWMMGGVVCMLALLLVVTFSQGSGQALGPQDDIVVVKTVDKGVVAPGEHVIYTVEISNTTGVTLEVPLIVDTLPAGFEYMGLAWNSEWGTEPSDSAPPEIQWTGPITVAPSDSLALRYWSRVPGYLALGPDPYTNTVVVSDSYTATAELLVALGEVTVDKTATADSVKFGERLTYTVAFNNSGYVTVPLASLVDVLPPDVTFADMTTQSQISDAPVGTTGTITWTGPYTIPAHGQLTAQYVVTMPISDEVLYLANLATGELGDGTQLQDSVQVRVADNFPIYMPIVVRNYTPPYFVGTKTADPSLAYNDEPAETVTYEVQFTNMGTGKGIIGAITDTLPAGFTFLGMAPGSSDGIGAPDEDQPGELVWRFDEGYEVPGGESVKLVYQALAVTTLGDHVNSATLSAELGETPDDPVQATFQVREPVLLEEYWSNPSPHWEPFLNYWRLHPEQWYVEGGAGVNGSNAIKHTYWYGANKPDRGAHDALYMYQSPDSESWTDYRFEAKIINHGDGFQGLWFRGKYVYSTDQGYHVEGYYLHWRMNRNTKSLVLSRLRTEGGTAYHFSDPEILVAVDKRINKGVWYTMAVEVVGDHIVVEVDGQKLIDHHDSTFSSGTVGLYTYQVSDAAWDNIIVTPMR